jgi:hypothetical protein
MTGGVEDEYFDEYGKRELMIKEEIPGWMEMVRKGKGREKEEEERRGDERENDLETLVKGGNLRPG